MQDTPMYDDLVALWATKGARHDDPTLERGETGTVTQHSEEKRLRVSDDAAAEA